MNRFGRDGAHYTRGGPLRELADQIGDQPGPAGLVGCATAPAIVAVEVFMEQDVVLEMRIGLKFFVAAENRTSTIGTAQEDLEQSAAQLVRYLLQRQLLPDPVGHSNFRPSP